jgi:hypothetical protein
VLFRLCISLITHNTAPLAPNKFLPADTIPYLDGSGGPAEYSGPITGLLAVFSAKNIF